MKKLIVTIILFIVLFYSRGFSQSTWQPSYVDMVFDLNDITMTDGNTAYIAGNDNENYGGTILKTTNAGVSWSHYYTKSGELNGISFPSAGTGFACSLDGSVAKTTNSGYTWQTKQLNSSKLNSIFFINNNTGFIVGYDGTVGKTVNGGLNWYISNIALGYVFTGVHFADANTGYICGYSLNKWGGGIVYKTTNAGVSWTPKQFSFDKINKIFFVNASTGFMVGVKPGNAIWKTTNGGQSWQDKYLGLPSEPKDVFFINAYVGIAAGKNGMVLRTNNGGNNWVLDNSNTSFNLNAVWIVDASTEITCNYKGYIVGTDGIILKNNNVPPLNCGSHKVYICHNDHTICVDTHAIDAHLMHGDFLGQCTNNNEGQYKVNQNPEQFKLYANYPNPFNPSTKIMFDLPFEANTKLIIYDAVGREVLRLVDNLLTAGKYEYEWNASNYASGIYYYKIFAGDFTDIKKMVLIK